eukprot:1161350-Pelagomonas_calceolata.AAC.7
MRVSERTEATEAMHKNSPHRSGLTFAVPTGFGHSSGCTVGRLINQCLNGGEPAQMTSKCSACAP